MTTLSEIILAPDLDLAAKTRKVSDLLDAEPEISNLEGAQCLKHAVRYAYNEILKLLLSHKVDVDVFDADAGRVQTALYEISKDDGTQGWKWNSETVSILINANADVSFDKGFHLRTPLHWAATQGHTIIVQKLLEHVSLRLPRDQIQEYINRPSYQEKTPLHLATQNGHADIVRLLLFYGANVCAICTNDRTPLHLSAKAGSTESVVMLLNAAPTTDFVNARTSDGATALHFAAEEGHSRIVRLLLRDHRSLKNPKDRRYWTPLLKASAQGHHEMFGIFAPYLVEPSPSSDVEDACYSYNASVFDFYKEADETRILSSKYTVADLLHRRQPGNEEAFLVPTNAKDMSPSPCWRWVHLPANNLAWVEALMNRAIIERKSSNVESFRQVFQALDQQNRAMRIHSRQMRPGYQRFPHGDASKPQRLTVTTTLHDDQPSPPDLAGTDEPAKEDDSDTVNDYGVLYLPYLHWDYYQNQKRLKEVVRQSSKPTKLGYGTESSTLAKDEILIRSYLRPSTNLHLRRTLDQFRYPSMSTEKRDRDQVVYRYQKHQIQAGRAPYKDPKVFMVDQLWVWILDRFVLTAFPETENDPLDLLRGIISDLKLSEEPVETEMFILTTITERCLGFFEREPVDSSMNLYRNGLNFFEMFEESVGRLTVSATELLEQFQEDVTNVTQWLRSRSRQGPADISDPARKQNDDDADSPAKSSAIEFDPSFVNRLINISKETQLSFECIDIEDELTTLSLLIEQQRAVIVQFLSTTSAATYPIPVRKAEEQLQSIDQDIAGIERLQKQCKDVSSILDRLLDLKPRHATAIEARFARDQAEDTARSGQIIMVFTIVTIIFLPLSFLAAFFAINISAFPRDSNDNMPLGWVSKYLFGIGLAVSVPLIAIAFAFGDMSNWMERFKNVLPKRTRTEKNEESIEDIPVRAPTWKSEAYFEELPALAMSKDNLHRRTTHKPSIPLNSPQQALPNEDVV